MHNDDFNVILIAAGCSRRLAHLTRDKPKAFLQAGGRPIIERNLDTIDSLGFREVTIVVGYLRHVFYDEIGDRYKGLAIRYVEAPDYETTGHGWSIFQTREGWQRGRRPVVLVHGDLVYDPKILSDVMAMQQPNVISIDNCFESETNDEVLACGTDARVTRIQKISEDPADVIGEIIGINKWSAKFVDQLFSFMSRYFADNGNDHNWEPVVDAFLRSESVDVHPMTTDGLRWININYEADLERAQAICDPRSA